MKFYFVDNVFVTTLGEAKRIARERAASSYQDITVDHVQVDTDRATILRLVNNEGGYMQTLIEAVYTAKAKLKRERDDR